MIAHGAFNFSCFDEQTTLVYKDSGREITNLPTIRLFQGVYGTQWAMQWTAYVFLSEKLGVNVSWYPSDDHDILTDPDKYNFDITPGYPDYYLKWTSQDKVDLLFEIWPGAMHNAS